MPIAPGAHVQARAERSNVSVRIALSRTGILSGNAKQELARTGRVVLRLRSTLSRIGNQAPWGLRIVRSSFGNFFWRLPNTA
ncbi:Uncharacterised protein [uncultured Collinsella sp.]|nr:Uncharacterised protein [uncultured Collinsella sp.]